MKHIYCILISCLIVVSAYTQPKQKEISHYLFPEFTEGLILLKTGEKYDVLLNYNALTEEVIFEDKGKKLAIAKNVVEIIDTVFIKERKFIALNSILVELLYHSKLDLYVEHKCRVKEKGTPIGYGSRSKNAAIKSYSAFYSEGNLNKLKLPDIYEIEPYTIYWLKKNGKTKRFRSMRELKKLYKDKGDLFKAYVKEYDVEYNNQESIIQLIEYLETN